MDFKERQREKILEKIRQSFKKSFIGFNKASKETPKPKAAKTKTKPLQAVKSKF